MLSHVTKFFAVAGFAALLYLVFPHSWASSAFSVAGFGIPWLGLITGVFALVLIVKGK